MSRFPLISTTGHSSMPGRASWVFPSAVLLVAIAADVLMWRAFGWRAGGDYERYADGARRLLSGIPLDDRQLGYIGYIGILASATLAGVGIRAVYYFQLALSACAGVAAFSFGRALNGVRAGLLCGLLWAGFVDIQRWNYYLLTDGPFFSSVMICCFFVFKARNGGWSHLAAAVASLLFMASLRINGCLFAVYLVGLLMLNSRRASERAALACAAAAILLMPVPRQVLQFAVHPQDSTVVRMGTFDFLVEGQVIWDNDLIPMPPLKIGAKPGIGTIATYVTSHPLAVAHLFALRLGHYLFAYNPRYSRTHRIWNIGFFTLLYLLAGAGIVAVGRRTPWIAALCGLWIWQAALVVLTVGDYDGRFSLYAVPALLPFVASAFNEHVLARVMPVARSAI
jgi:hypothetical protein